MAYKIAGVQMDIQLSDAEENFANIERNIATTVAAGAQLTVFPECTLTGYCFEELEEALEVAQPIDGPHVQRAIAIAADLKTTFVFGMLERDDDGTTPQIYNTVVMVDPSGVVATYRKTHLPTLGVDRFTTPGDRPLEVVRLPEINFGMNICYDCSFPETARLLALGGADVILLPTNWPPGAGRVPDYIPNVRALENNVYYMSVNRIGTEGGFEFVGKSKICDPLGGEIASADHDQEAIIYGEVDVQWARKKHYVSVPGKHEVHRFLDRRPDLYQPLTKPNEDTDD